MPKNEPSSQSICDRGINSRFAVPTCNASVDKINGSIRAHGEYQSSEDCRGRQNAQMSSWSHIFRKVPAAVVNPPPRDVPEQNDERGHQWEEHAGKSLVRNTRCLQDEAGRFSDKLDLRGDSECRVRRGPPCSHIFSVWSSDVGSGRWEQAIALIDQPQSGVSASDSQETPSKMRMSRSTVPARIFKAD